MSDLKTSSQKELADLLKSEFPWLGTDDEAEGGETIGLLAELYERLTSGSVARGILIGNQEREWDTKEVIQIDGDYFYRLMNGGSRGSRDRQRGDGSWDSSPLECRQVDATEARRLLLGFGWEPAAVAEAIR